MDDKYLIDLCFKEIAKKLNWKNYKNWTGSDYKILSNLIETETKIRISPQTLKRLSGKLYYNINYHPQIASKDALAMFINYKDWNEFLLTNKPNTNVLDKIVKFSFLKKYIYYAIVIFMISLITIVAIIFNNSHKPVISDYTLNVEDSIGTVPHNVKVLYDISRISNDSIIIDFNYEHPILGPQKIKLDKSKGFLNFTYQIPGVYNVDLKLEGKVLASKKVFALTNDWVTYFIPETDMNHLWLDNIVRRENPNNKLFVSRRSLLEQGFESNKIFDIMHRIMKNFNIDGNNFKLKLRYKNSASTGGITCYDTEIRFHCVNFINFICLAEKDCQQFSKLKFGEVELKGDNNDLSGLTFNPDIVNELIIENQNKKVSIFLNESLIYSLKYEQNNGNIMGIDCIFKGCGIVESISLEDLNGENQFREDFGSNLEESSEL